MCTISRNQLFVDLRRWIRIPGELINKINSRLKKATNSSALFDSSLSKVIVQSLMAALARSAGGFNSSSPNLLTAITNLHTGCLKVPWPSKLQKSCTVLTLRARSSIIYQRCNDSIIFLKYRCIKMYLFIWKTEYLKMLGFISLRCSVLFSFVMTMKWLTSWIIIIAVMTQ